MVEGSSLRYWRGAGCVEEDWREERVRRVKVFSGKRSKNLDDLRFCLASRCRGLVVGHGVPSDKKRHYKARALIGREAFHPHEN